MSQLAPTVDGEPVLAPVPGGAPSPAPNAVGKQVLKFMEVFLVAGSGAYVQVFSHCLRKICLGRLQSVRGLLRIHAVRNYRI